MAETIHEICGDAEYNMALEYLERFNNESTLQISGCIKLQDILPGTEFRSFTYGWPHFSYIAIYRSDFNGRAKCVYVRPMVHQNSTESRKLFEYVFNTFPGLKSGLGKIHGRFLAEDAAILQEIVHSIKLPFWSVPISMAYIHPDKYDDVNQFNFEKSLDPKYYVSNLTSADSGLVNANWINNDGEENTKIRLDHLPSVCIRRKDDNSLISWVHTLEYGYVGNLYTLEQYRGQGLTGIISNKLNQEMIRRNLPLINYVRFTNDISMGINQRSNIWTVSKKNYVLCKFGNSLESSKLETKSML